eukprot:TRINITY_DN6251_c0_g1_i3.p1 TRINITY_DN6251_c0_g1~~TRINITY_DN6251_c0_g1_i3.p1  ORF type:complete len:138 (+),score=29.28 TRINITY_DN6251_c0_g1_i3:87-500(+)
MAYKNARSHSRTVMAYRRAAEASKQLDNNAFTTARLWESAAKSASLDKDPKTIFYYEQAVDMYLEKDHGDKAAEILIRATTSYGMSDNLDLKIKLLMRAIDLYEDIDKPRASLPAYEKLVAALAKACLLYTSDAADE